MAEVEAIQLVVSIGGTAYGVFKTYRKPIYYTMRRMYGGKKELTRAMNEYETARQNIIRTERDYAKRRFLLQDLRKAMRTKYPHWAAKGQWKD